MEIRNRNKENRKVRAGDLVPHPKNWKHHDERQTGAMLAILEEVGFVGSLVARETKDGLQLINGHLRAGIDPEHVVDVAIVDLDDKEVDLILATHDMVGEMAIGDAQQLDSLLEELDVASSELADMFSDYLEGVNPAL